jgi:hypothetical protein
VCPSCGLEHAAGERFCRDCGLPLVHAPGAGDGGKPLSQAQERARKMRPQLSEGPLVRVATARHQAEAEMLEGLLLEAGIPSLVRRTGGFDVPDFLASGPRDILVPASGAELAREVLGLPEPVAATATGEGEGVPAWVKALAVALAVAIVALIAAGVFAALA